MIRAITLATLVSGTLDILMAILLTIANGGAVPGMLRFVASGPFPGAPDWGTAGAFLGLIVHFALMAIMAAVFMLATQARPKLLDRPIIAGISYGIATYIVLDLIVVPLRFHRPLPPSALSIVTQLFAHVVLVGIVFALIAARAFRRPSPDQIAAA